MAGSPDLLLVLDFEATCDGPVQLPQQEIIEFPVLALDVRSLTVISEYHVYVQPQLTPRITSYCTELTGITQDMVDSGVSLQQALQGCEQWLAGLGVDPTRPFPVLSPGTTLPSAAEAAPASVPCTGLIVTCGDWDMRHLAKEAKSKGLHPAPIFSTWINIKVPYSEVKQLQDRPPDMMGMLNGLGIQHEGRHHSGIDDCRNIAKLMCELIRQGASPLPTSLFNEKGSMKRAPGRFLPGTDRPPRPGARG